MSVCSCGRQDCMERHHTYVCLVDVCTSQLHTNHAGPQDRGPHLMFKLIASENPAMLGYKRKDIMNWMFSRGIQDSHFKTPTPSQKWCERTSKERVALQVGCPSAHTGSARSGTADSLYASSTHFDFAKVAAGQDFTENTPYLVPGSIVVPHTRGGPTCSLFTTVNFSLNLIRARMWYGPQGVAGAVDHTFKVSCNGSFMHAFTRLSFCTVLCLSYLITRACLI